MKKLIVLLALPFLPLSVEAGSRTYQPGYSQEQTCYENVYREEYIPGTAANPGRVVSRRERIEVACQNQTTYTTPTPTYDTPNVDDNSCVEGSIIGGLLGGGLGAALSQGDGRWWAIPTGIAGGAMVGCQVDGG
tara:strand:- start:737 stop:1138 length:402 start_codon:yes stop_codon:yes gene_type:complete